MGWHRSFSLHSQYLLRSFFSFPAATVPLLFFPSVWCYSVMSISLLHPISVSRFSSLPDRLSLSLVGWYVSVSPHICFTISLGLSMLLENRGIGLCIPHPWSLAHFYQQTVLSFTITSEQTALCTQLVKPVSMDMKLGKTCSTLASWSWSFFFPPQ